MNINLLQVVNRKNLLPTDFVPEGLVTIVNRENSIVYAPLIVWDAFNTMMREGSFKGQYLDLTSCYRSYQRQKELFDDSLLKNGIEKTLKNIAIPGSSEHQLGLDIDISNFTSEGLMRDDDDRFKWVHENCSSFGFIIRYKEDFQSVTGIKYEPWHLRYVGQYAPKITSLNLPLEEIVRRQLI